MHIMDSKKPLYKSIPFWVMVLFLLYSALGFLAVPYYLKNQLTKLAQTELHSQIFINKISFNPYTIAVDVSELSLRDIGDKTSWFKTAKAHANLNLWETLFNYVSLSKIHLENPHYQLVLEHNKKGIQLKYPQLVNNNSPSENKPLQLDVDDLSINQGGIKYTDASTHKTLNLDFSGIQFNQKAFTTQDNDIPFDLSFTTERDHRAVISGHYSFAQSSLNADWKVDNWSTVTLLKLAGELDHEILGIYNHSGNITAQGQINYSQMKPEQSNLTIDTLLLTEFNSTDQSKQAVDLKIQQLTLSHANIELNQQKITIENIQTEGSSLSVGMDENNQLLWNPPTDTVSNNTENIWQLTLKKITLENSDIFVSKIKQHNVLHIAQLQASDMSSITAQAAQFSLTGVIDESAPLKVSSQLHFSPFEINADIQLDDLKLKDWQTWMPSTVHMKIDNGLLSTQQHITIKANSSQIIGNLKLKDAVFLDDVGHEFFAIDQLLIDKNSIDFNKKIVVLDSIILNHAQGDLLIAEDKTLNINTIVNAATKTTKPSEKHENNPKNSDWKISINAIELNDGQTSITDKSIKPNYRSQLSKVKGTIKGLSSQNLSKADVQLSGLLDTYAQLNISGQINPLSDTAFTDLKIDINNLDMQNFSTYSSQYLGFPIQRGKADFTLKYKLNQYILKGINNLTFKQLKFADKSVSEEAINLPIKLAVNLLTDGKGIMKINLPVRGNVNDPNFSYGGLVFKAFFKLITGIVASPFKLLGKLIPNAVDLDLSGIQFQAGMAELKSSEFAKLQAIQKVMLKRPKINLELTPVINSIEDEKALKTQQLLKLLNLTHVPNLTQMERLKPIKKIYIKTFNQQKWQQLTQQATQNQQLNQTQLLQKAWKQLLASQNVSELLNQLSVSRAQYIQSELIEQLSVAKEKIFIQASETSATLYPQVKFGIAGL